MILEREREHRLEWQLQGAGEVFAQMIVDLMADGPAVRRYLENFRRIENVFRVERALDLTHDFEQLVPELFTHVFGARDAYAVLGGERARELPHQRRGLIGALPKLFQISCVVQM